MSEEYKRKLYEYFLQNTPIKYESVTDQQWLQMQTSLAGISISLQQAFSEVTKAMSQIWRGMMK